MTNHQALSSMRQGKRFIDEAATGTQMPPRVSIESNQFTLIDPSGAAVQVPNRPEGPAIDVVFADLNQHMSKIYWGRDFKPNEANPPICFSDNGVAPSSAAQDAQSPTCAACPHNVIGSAISKISGARIKACQDFKKVAVVVRGYPGAYLFTIKPGSFKAWTAYTNFLRLQKLPDGGRPDLCDVVTRITFASQGILAFEAIEFPDEELRGRITEIWDRNQTQDVTGVMIGRYDQPAQNVLPKPAGQVAPPPQQPQPVGSAQPFLSGRDPGGALFPPPQPQPTTMAAQPAPAPTDPKPRAARGKPKTVAPAPSQALREQIQPAQPAAPAHGMQQPTGGPPTDVAQRLNSLFNLPSK
jgi:hypothetical protein